MNFTNQEVSSFKVCLPDKMIQNFNKFETQFKLKEELLEVTVLLPTPIHGQPALPQSIVGAQSSARSLS